jgi:N-acetylglucosamine-6-phosphate deacetylase
MLGLALPDAVAMASTNPAAFLGLGHELGRIAAGHRANLVLLDKRLEVQETWVEGVRAGTL